MEALALVRKNLWYLAWITAFLAMVGSLYFSEIAGLVPCLLCWYQRIFMYPLVIVLTVGILTKDKLLPFYVLPLSLIGAVFAFFHYLLQMGVIQEGVLPCQLGVSCSGIDFSLFSFITIPFLSLLAFLLITISALISWRYNK